MSERLRYLKRKEQFVTAVQLDLETDGFTYRKWGGMQRCAAGDWLVNNDGDTYTVSRDSFARTYERLERGKYRKITPIWAEVATEAGAVRTNEGMTSYRPGDYLVSNDSDGHDQYAISKAKFEKMYEPAEQSLHTTAGEKVR
jgi:hypothetical protein